jgi:hypothetical protein
MIGMEEAPFRLTKRSIHIIFAFVMRLKYYMLDTVVVFKGLQFNRTRLTQAFNYDLIIGFLNCNHANDIQKF